MWETICLYFHAKKIRYWHRNLFWIFRLLRFFLPLGLLLVWYGWVVARRIYLSEGWQGVLLRGEVSWQEYVLVPWWIFLVVPIVWGISCIIWEILFDRLFPGWYSRRFHLQQLSRMIVTNGWLDRKNRQGKERITWFPRMFYQMQQGMVYLMVENTMGRYQSQFLTLQQKVETGILCELMGIEVGERYIRYRFLYQLERCRIRIEQVLCQKGSLLLMEGVEWKFDKQPHALIVGGTGGGKTFLILTLIESLLKAGAEVIVLDPKRADLSDLGQVIPQVYSKKEEMISKVIQFYFDMLDTYDRYKHMEGYYTGCNYRAVGLSPHFLVFDEYVAFMDMLGYSTADKIMTYLRKIAMLGRQVGYFLILACQRPDAKYFADGMRDQFHLRIALGRNSEMGYSMVFGSEVKKTFLNRDIPGRGYVDRNLGIVHEFYAPYVPEGYDFLVRMKELGFCSTTPILQEDLWTLERGAEEELRLSERTQRILMDMGIYSDPLERQKDVRLEESSSLLPDDRNDETGHENSIFVQETERSLKSLRESFCLTQSECAKKLGISRQRLSDYESGRGLSQEVEDRLRSQMEKWCD